MQRRGGLGQRRGALMHQRVRHREQRVERAETHVVAVATVISNAISALWLYLRGFGVSFVPAVLTLLGVCGVRIAWVRFVFPPYRTFASIMAVSQLHRAFDLRRSDRLPPRRARADAKGVITI